MTLIYVLLGVFVALMLVYIVVGMRLSARIRDTSDIYGRDKKKEST